MTAVSATIPEVEAHHSKRLQRSRARLMKGMVGTLNCTPMVDLIFNLLVYFLCVGLVSTPEGGLPARLPSTHGEASFSLPLSPIEVYLVASTTGEDIKIHLRPQNIQLGGMPQLYAQMRALSASREFGIDAPVILLPDRNVKVSYVADAYNAVFQAGFRQIAFGERTD